MNILSVSTASNGKKWTFPVATMPFRTLLFFPLPSPPLLSRYKHRVALAHKRYGNHTHTHTLLLLATQLPLTHPMYIPAFAPVWREGANNADICRRRNDAPEFAVCVQAAERVVHGSAEVIFVSDLCVNVCHGHETVEGIVHVGHSGFRQLVCMGGWMDGWMDGWMGGGKGRKG